MKRALAETTGVVTDVGSVKAHIVATCDDERFIGGHPMAGSELEGLDGDVEELDGSGLSAIPGLVDCHTHACWAGDRLDEWERSLGGAPVARGSAAGGGIQGRDDPDAWPRSELRLYVAET